VKTLKFEPFVPFHFNLVHLAQKLKDKVANSTLINPISEGTKFKSPAELVTLANFSKTDTLQ